MWPLHLIAIIGYIGMIQFWKPAKRYKLKNALIMWNVFWTVLSFRMAFSLCQYLWRGLSFPDGVCSRPLQHATSDEQYWVFVFLATKPLEMIDTVFLKLRGKHVRVIHWVHHLLTTIYCTLAFSFIDHDFTLIWFAAMNSFVHVPMYAYYSGFRSFPANIITSIQIAQMVIAITVTLASPEARASL